MFNSETKCSKMLASLTRTIAILVYNRDVCDPCSKIGTYLTDPAFSLLNTLIYHRGAPSKNPKLSNFRKNLTIKIDVEHPPSHRKTWTPFVSLSVYIYTI